MRDAKPSKVVEIAIKKIKEAQAPLILNLIKNKIEADDAKFLAEAIKEARIPLTLNLYCNNMGEVGAKFLAEGIKKARVPLTLDLRSNKIREGGAKFLAEAIKEARLPLTLNLYCNNIGEAGAKFLAEAIKEIRVSLTLDLRSNQIGEAGAEFLAQSLKEARAPLTLGLAENRIGEAGAKFFAQSLKEVRVPLALSLAENRIGEAGAKFLAEAIKEAQAPLDLDLLFNQIGEAGAESLAQSLKEARVPLNLNLMSNKIGDAGAKFLAEGIKKARVPLNLNLYKNEIGEAGIKSLAEGIKKARVPLTLDLRGNEIVGNGAKFLAQSLKEARVPLNLDLGYAVEEDYIADALANNFILDAGKDPSKFSKRIEFSPSERMLEQALSCPSVLAKLVQGYIGDDSIAWIDVAAIRAVEGASRENKYDSIDYDLLTAIYSTATVAYVAPVLEGVKMEDDHQEARGASSSISSSSQSQFLTLLLLLSRIKALSNRLEIPQGYVDVPGDGLCFYHAIARQLGNNVYSALELQQMAINEIINHLGRYEEFVAQYGGGWNGFLNYHLQRQDSEKGGWADNIMIQALANALERVIEVQLFDHVGNAIGAGPIAIHPHHVANTNVLRLGNLGNLHFVAAAAASDEDEEVSLLSTNAMVDDGLEEAQVPIARPLKRKQIFAGDAEANKAIKLEAVGNIQEEINAPGKDEGDNYEEKIDWDQYRCEVQDDGSALATTNTTATSFISEISPAPNATSVYYETLEFGDASSFELGGLH